MRGRAERCSARFHPEHIPGAGPEQDYLSRFYAPSWTHIGVAFNYQLHHVFIVLEAWLQHIVSGGHKEVPWVPERLEMELQDLCIVHFSGELKMWDRDYFSDETDEDFATRVLRDCSYKSAQLWLDKTAQDHFGGRSVHQRPGAGDVAPRPRHRTVSLGWHRCLCRTWTWRAYGWSGPSSAGTRVCSWETT